MLRKVLTAAIVIFGTTTGSGVLSAAEPTVNAGKLVCTVEPRPAGTTNPEREISCRFQPISGVPYTYNGSIKRLAGPPLVGANLVLVWTVLATKSDPANTSLNGRYLSNSSDADNTTAVKLGSLRRETTAPIELRALTRTSAGKTKPTLILELELRSTRV